MVECELSDCALEGGDCGGGGHGWVGCLEGFVLLFGPVLGTAGDSRVVAHSGGG